MTTTRKNITQPADWWAAFEAEAKRSELTLSEWLGECAKHCLPTGSRKTLSQRPGAHRPRVKPASTDRP